MNSDQDVQNRHPSMDDASPRAGGEGLNPDQYEEGFQTMSGSSGDTNTDPKGHGAAGGNAPGENTVAVPVEPLQQRIAQEYWNVMACRSAHLKRAQLWETISSWSRLLVTLTSGVSAISLVADNLVLSTVFAFVTAGAAALNSGFSPSEQAKKHRDASTAYGHMRRPLDHLRMRFYGELRYVPETSFDAASGLYYDSGYYEATGAQLKDVDVLAIQKSFGELQQRLETIEDAAPIVSDARIAEMKKKYLARAEYR